MFQSLQSASLNLIKQADQFGAVFKPTIKLKTQQYKTVQGGMISIVIYGLSLAYFVYGIQQWATNQILPNIVDFKEVKEVIEYQSTEKIISIESEVEINPFDKSNIILLVVIQQISNGWPSSELIRIKQTDGFYIQNFSLRIDNKNNQTSKELFVFIIPCDENYLDIDEQCAQQNTIEQYWNQSNYLLVKFFTHQFNTNTRSLKQLSKLFYVSFSQDQTFINNLYFQQTNAIIDQGILFPNYKDYSFISDILQQSQSISYQSGTKLFQISSYICLVITMDTLQIQQNIAFPNISTVLASIGSIISSLLFFSYIAILINQKSLEDEAIFDVIKMFYPEFNEIIFKKNWLGQIKSIQNNQTNLFYNVEEYKQYYNRLTQVAEQKLCMSNMIYEMSRLQFAIQQLISKDELIKLRDKHLKIQLSPQKLKQKDLARIKQASFSQIQPSNDRESKIIEIRDLKDDELDLSIQQIVHDSQDNLNYRQEQESIDDDFDLFCQQRFQFVKK